MITIKAKADVNNGVSLELKVEGKGEEVFAETVSILTRFPQEMQKANPELLHDALAASKAVLETELLTGERRVEEVQIDTVKQ